MRFAILSYTTNDGHEYKINIASFYINVSKNRIQYNNQFINLSEIEKLEISE